MYYLDIINISKNQSANIFSEILSDLHVNKYNYGEFAIDFPNYRIGEEDIYLKKHAAKSPQIGTIIRIFSETKEGLQKIVLSKTLKDNVIKNLINVSEINNAPKTKEYVVWVKNLTKDHLNKKLKELKKNNFKNVSKEALLSQIKTLRNKEENEEFKLIYLKVKSNSNNNLFSLFLERIIVDERNFSSLETTSYGLSFKNNLMTLPLF